MKKIVFIKGAERHMIHTVVVLPDVTVSLSWVLDVCLLHREIIVVHMIIIIMKIMNFCT